MSYWGANYWGPSYWGPSYWGGTGELIAAEQEREDAMHFNAARARRAHRQQMPVEPSPRPAAEPAPLPPNQVVDAIAAMLRNPRGTPSPVRRTRVNFGGGTDL